MWRLVFDAGQLLKEVFVDEPVSQNEEKEPFGQRFFNSPFLLLLLGLVVMFGFYTIWGIIEIASVPPATLP